MKKKIIAAISILVLFSLGAYEYSLYKNVTNENKTFVENLREYRDKKITKFYKQEDIKDMLNLKNSMKKELEKETKSINLPVE